MVSKKVKIEVKGGTMSRKRQTPDKPKAKKQISQTTIKEMKGITIDTSGTVVKKSSNKILLDLRYKISR